ncbi:alpha/beta fold hydrolase [Caldovatus aquaticus]|uniref:Alpha/beta fold hydrolase n=1 Tax=Caldovatus aquaticus TaxID=2865671 RepID=A0ABS7EYW1_9PROT|nr:alpha/beta fold hydrolase [Caldovatus aquaticus]MBW8268539.1 alpha/beta fold hydrolase [Caldovatus aquaticus]
MPRPLRHRFVPRPPFLGGTLQTLRGVAWPIRPALPRPGHRLRIPLPDGDQLAASLHLPAAEGAPERRRPLALLVHGLVGTENDPCLRAAARALIERGFPVLRLNLRGNALSGPRSTSHYHIGRAEDLRDVLRALPPALTEAGVAVAGWSLGGGLVLNLLGRHAEEEGMPRLLAGAAISAPLDPAAAHAAMEAHRLFGPLLLALYRREVLAVARARDLDAGLRVAAAAARSVREFEAMVSAPRFGFPSYATYVELTRPGRALPAIRVPTLLLQAADDPIVPAASLEAVDWADCPAVQPVLAAGGGHCGFEDVRLGRDPMQTRALVAFFEGAAEAAAAGQAGASAGAMAAATAHQGAGSEPSSTAQAAARAAPA